ncbi:MAG: aspartyl protease family protein [Cyclobacteriaceae bacterium]|nr:aspartyl protease family protein [Cyclobacteriaceae bacterium]
MNRFFILVFFIPLFFTLSVFAQNQEIARVPFILNNDHIIIKLSINGSTEMNFMFDSGAGGILINKNFSDSIGLESASERINTGAVGTHTVSILKGNSIRVGDAQINNINMMRDENSFEQLDTGEEIAGIIGFHLLSRFVIKVDYNSFELVFYNRSNYAYEGDGIIMPIVLTYNLPLIVSTVIINNDTEFEGFFLVDTGARSELIISSPTVNKFNMIDAVGDHYVLKTEVGSSGKKAKIMYGKVKGLGFAEHKFTQVPVILSQAENGVLSFNGIDGIIGNRILKRFNIIFDYHRSLIYLEPNANLSKKYSVNVSGFSIYFKDGQPLIKNIIEHSPATRAGLKNGDYIVAIEGIVVEDLTAGQIRDYFSKLGIKLKLVIKRGSKLKYTEIKLKALI